MDLFQTALRWLDKAEGGFTVDTGGATYRGVTQAVYDEYCKEHNKPLRYVTSLTVGEWEDIARHLYWQKAGCDALPERTAVAVFDWAFNSGPEVAVKHLQKVLGIPDKERDGIVGPKTINRAHDYPDGLLANKYLDEHQSFYDYLVQMKPSRYKAYQNGWKNRVQNLRAFLIKELP